MQTFPQRFIFADKEIDFEITGSNVMANATQMAKIYEKRMDNFTRTDETNRFISACLNNANKCFLNIETEDDLIVSSQKTVTWMHRILAQKFTTWLNPTFELWVYSVIDKLLFGHYREMEDMIRRSTETRNRIDALREQLRDDDRFAELESLEVLYKQYLRIRSRKTTEQIELFCSISR
ncbi:MAG: KilA-N domain-containing protein [Bacteroidota bacterium]